MEKPYIICHMLTSLDGKIVGRFLDEAKLYTDEYYRIHRDFHCDAFVCGRITMEGSFTQGYQVDLSPYEGKSVDREDYIGGKGKFYAVAIDPLGKLGWKENHIEDDDSGYDQAHIIEVLCEEVSDAYLCYLREKGISYVFGGKKELNLSLICHKLKTLFDIHLLLLEGGGYVNGSFADEQLIDELSVILVPIADCASHSTTLFEANQIISPVHFHLKDIQKISSDGLWLRYVK